MVHVDTRTRAFDVQDASITTLRRLDSATSETSTGSRRRGGDVDVTHGVELDETVAQRALSPHLWTALKETPILFGCVLVGALSFLYFGFDTAIIGNVQPLQGYKDAMGLTHSTAAEIASLNGWVTSSMSLAGGIMALFVPLFSDRLGRKKTMILGTAVNTLGACIQAAANGPAMIIAGRCINGAALGILLLTGPPYIAELSHKSIRGFVGAMSGLSYTLGAFGAAIVAYSFVNSAAFDNNSWRWMLGIQAAFSTIVLPILFILPESPRWLVTRGRDMEARKQLLRIRKDTTIGQRTRRYTRARSDSESSGYSISQAPSSIAVDQHFSNEEWGLEREPLSTVDVELMSIIEDVSRNQEEEKNQKLGWLSLLHPSQWLRSSIAICMPLSQQMSGQSLLLYYGPQIYKSIGLNTQIAAMAVNGTAFGSTFIAMFLFDRIGRRSMFLTGNLLCAMCMACMAALFSTLTISAATPTNGQAVLSICIVFECFYSLCFATLAFSYVPEVFSNVMRVRGTALAMVVKFFVGFGITRASPTMLLPVADGGFGSGGTYLFFCCWLTAALIWASTHMAETSGLPLEAMDAVFSITSWKAYRQYVWDNLRYNGKRNLSALQSAETNTAQNVSTDNQQELQSVGVMAADDKPAMGVAKPDLDYIKA